MKNKFLILLVLSFVVNNFSAQQIAIEITGSELNAKLLRLEGENIFSVDSVICNDGIYKYSLENKSTGFYRLKLNNRLWLDFVYDKEDIHKDLEGYSAKPSRSLIDIKTNINAVVDSLQVLKSESNKIYYQFIKLNKSFKEKTEMLQLVLARYPKDDEFYEVTLSKVKHLQNQYLNFVNEVYGSNPNSFIARYVKSSQLPIVDYTLPIEEQLDYLKLHALDNVDFNDAGLISSNCFTNKSIEYLMYYRNPQLPKELLEKEFMKAVDTLLNKAKVNSLVYKHITEYLIDGFRKFGFDLIIDYIVDNYVIADDICLDEKLEHSIQNRIDQSKYLKVGAEVSNIILEDENGREGDLSKINSDKKLIIFYSTQCPHCKEMLPEINKLYQDKKNFEVYAVSIDSSKSDWQTFIKENNLTWINVIDTDGWFGNTARKYYLYATPTMFLIDNENKIIAKPTNLNELKPLL